MLRFLDDFWKYNFNITMVFIDRRCLMVFIVIFLAFGWIIIISSFWLFSFNYYQIIDKHTLIPITYDPPKK